MFATVDDVKGFVWLQYSDAKIEMLLEATTNDITSVVWDITYGIKTEDISICDINKLSIFLTNIQVHKILQINWKDYVGNYEILKPQNRRVILTDIYSYINNSWTNKTFKIKYISWYTIIPSDIILAQTLIVSDMLESWWWRQISKYKMWPRTVEYESWSTSSYKDKAEEILNRYRLLKI